LSRSFASALTAFSYAFCENDREMADAASLATARLLRYAAAAAVLALPAVALSVVIYTLFLPQLSENLADVPAMLLFLGPSLYLRAAPLAVLCGLCIGLLRNATAWLQVIVAIACSAVAGVAYGFAVAWHTMHLSLLYATISGGAAFAIVAAGAAIFGVRLRWRC